jgi:hypothetical protein
VLEEVVAAPMSVGRVSAQSILNFTVGVQTRFDSSLSQVWRSVRVRLSGTVTEILLGHDVNSHGLLNSTHFYVTFCASISGPAMARFTALSFYW